MANQTLQQILVELNTEEITRLVPLIIFLALIVTTGIPGNLFVCLVYRRSYRDSNSKFFILCLAIADLLSCCVVTLEIVNVANQYTYSGDWLCKMTIFLEIWPVMTSGGLLCVISVDRYRKVCHPFGWQISDRAAKITCAAMVFLSFNCAWPALILFGVKAVRTHDHNINGTECGILTRHLETTPSKVFNGILWIIFVTSVSILSVLYCFIVRKIIKQPKKTRSQAFKSDTNLPKKNDPSDVIEGDTASSSSVFRQGWTGLKAVTSISSFGRESCVSPSQGTRGRQQTASDARTMKSAYIMCLVSVVFICSFLPYLILRLLEALDPEFVQSLSTAGRAANKTILRCYFLNCSINPIIYCVCSTYFRRDLLKILRGICHRLWQN